MYIDINIYIYIVLRLQCYNGPIPTPSHSQLIVRHPRSLLHGIDGAHAAVALQALAVLLATSSVGR